MASYPVGTDVTVRIALTDDATPGNAVTPTGLSYVVFNETGLQIAGPTAIVSLTGTYKDILIPGAINADAGSREVLLTIVTSTVTYQHSAYYSLRALGPRIVRLQNSFQTYANALTVADDIPGLTGWIAGSETDRQTCLIEAYRRLITHVYVIPRDELPDLQGVYVSKDIRHLKPSMWKLMTEPVYALYADGFKEGLNQAQVVEANEVLKGDKYGEKRRAGLLSESIGESSIMFRSGSGPLQTRASRVALAYVQRYLDNTIKLTRA